MKKWEDWTQEEKKEHNKKLLKSNIKEVINFILGLITFLIMSLGIEYMGKAIFDLNNFGFLGAIIFFGILLWHNKLTEDNDKKKSERIEEDKQVVFAKLRETDQLINEMYNNGDIDLDAANKLENSVNQARLKVIDINHEFVFLLFK